MKDNRSLQFRYMSEAYDPINIGQVSHEKFCRTVMSYIELQKRRGYKTIQVHYRFQHHSYVNYIQCSAMFNRFCRGLQIDVDRDIKFISLEIG